MQIHVVQRGQTVSGIAEAYNVTTQAIVRANELGNASRITVGQALVIPIVGKYHWVQSGQSLYSISRIYGINMNELARVNRISLSTPLRIGQRLYIPPQPKPTIDVFAFIEPRTTVTQAQINEVSDKARYLTYLGIFSYHANRDGSLTPPPLDNLPTIAANAGVTNVMVVTNLEEGAFSGDLAHDIFASDAVTNLLFTNIIETAKRIGYGDVHFDMEFIRPADRELYSSFLRKAVTRLGANGLTVSTAVAPKTNAAMGGIYAAHDYPTLGSIVNFIGIMTYEWGYTYSDPQAVSPIGPVNQVLQYAIQNIPRQKIMLGQNLYGYDWTAPYPPQGGPPARALSPQAATELAIERGVPIQYDYRAQAPFFRYVDDAGKQHEVWFEDARSIQAKFDLIKRNGIRGIMYWKLGLSFPQNWLLLTDNFNVRKR